VHFEFRVSEKRFCSFNKVLLECSFAHFKPPVIRSSLLRRMDQSKQLQTDYVSSHMDTMIKHPEVLEEFEDNFIRDDGKLSFNSAIRLFTYMWNEAFNLGVFPPKDPWEGIKVDIRIAKTLNSCLKKSSPR
jgi:hypothetical protein